MESSINNNDSQHWLRDGISRSASDVNENDAKIIARVKLEDRLSIVILLILYALQGIPMGLCGSLPLIMKERGVSYEGLSLFSLVSIPFSLKLFWAPLVDSLYFKSIGRRKTWLIPIQIFTGIVMLVSGSYVDTWIGQPVDKIDSTNEFQGPQVEILTAYFMFLYFLMATQDIVVDGWALTMLSRENVGYASICNSIGQVLGFFIANQGFIALSDPTWCHRFLGTTHGESIVTLSGFMTICGWIFIITTVIITIFKPEKPDESGEVPEGLIETYQHVIAIFRLKPVQHLVLILLTYRVAFSANDAVSGFKMQVNYINSFLNFSID